MQLTWKIWFNGIGDVEQMVLGKIKLKDNWKSFLQQGSGSNTNVCEVFWAVTRSATGTLDEETDLSRQGNNIKSKFYAVLGLGLNLQPKCTETFHHNKLNRKTRKLNDMEKMRECKEKQRTSYCRLKMRGMM